MTDYEQFKKNREAKKKREYQLSRAEILSSPDSEFQKFLTSRKNKKNLAQKQQQHRDFLESEDNVGFWESLAPGGATPSDWNESRKKKKQYQNEIDEAAAQVAAYEQFLKDKEFQEKVDSMTADDIDKLLSDYDNSIKQIRKEKGYFTNAEREIEAEQGKYRAVRDEKKSREMTENLPEDVIKLLDEYNSLGGLEEGNKIASIISPETSGMYNANNYKTSGRKQEIAKKLIEMGYNNFAELAEYRQYIKDIESNDQAEKEFSEFAKEHPLASSAIALATSPASRIAGTIGTTENLFGERKSDLGANPYSEWYYFDNYRNTVQGTVPETFEDGIVSQKNKKLFYDTFMSGADSIIGGMAGGTAGTFIYHGVGALNNGYVDVLKKGGTAEQALTTGIVNGVTEGVCEAISLGWFFKGVKPSNVKAIIQNILIQAGVNFQEESTTELVNIIADYYINGGISDYYTNYEQALSSGVSEKDAKEYAKGIARQQILDSGISGALMGGVFGAGGSAYGNYEYNSAMAEQGKKIVEDGNVETLLAGANDVDSEKNSALYKLAQEITENEQKAAQSEEFQYKKKDYQKIGKLVDRLETATANDRNKITEDAVAERLKQVKETGDISVISKAIVKKFNSDQKLSLKERNALKNSKKATQVYRELEGELYDAQWNRKRGTDIIDLYNRRYDPDIEAYRNRNSGKAQPQSDFSDTQEETPYGFEAYENKVKETVINEGQDKERFESDFNLFKTYGEVGRDFEEVKNNSSVSKDFTEVQMKAAYDVGVELAKSQKQTVLKGIQRVEGDEIYVTDTNDNVRKLSEVNTDKATRSLYNSAAKYDTETANIFVQGFNRSANVNSYRTAFRAFYGAGASSADVTFADALKANRSLVKLMTGEDAARKAFEQGRKERTKADSEVKQKKQTGKKPSKGTYQNKTITIGEEAVDEFYSALARKTGIDIERRQSLFNENDREANAQYEATKNKMTVSATATNEWQASIHELVHYAFAYNTEKMIPVKKAIVDYYISSNSTAEFERMLQNYKVSYQNATRAELEEEFTADAVGGMFSTDEGVNDFLDWLQNESGYKAKEKKTILQRITEWLNDIIEAIKDIMNDGELNGTGKKFAQQNCDELTKIRKQFLEVLDGAGVNYKTGGAVEGDVRYSLQYEKATVNEDIVSLIKKVKNKDYKDNNKVEFGIVSEKAANEIKKVSGIDVSGYNMVIEARQIYHILKDHGIDGKSDQSMSNDNDIAKMEIAFNSYDKISDGGRTKAYTYMKNGHNKTAPTVLYEKEIGEKSYYVVQAVPETKKRTLYVVTAFIGKKGYKKEASQLINAKNLDVTAKTGSVVTSNDIISNSIENVKQKQLEIIEKVNPAPNTYNTWIRKVEDIKTLDETLEDSDWADAEEINPDLTRGMIEEAIKSGEITVYSSYPIEQGAFVSPSYMEAASYSGDGNVYEKTVSIDDVAWIDPTQGMYAKVEEDTKYSLKQSLDWVDWDDYSSAREESLVKKVTELEKINEDLRLQIRHPGQKHVINLLETQRVMRELASGYMSKVDRKKLTTELYDLYTLIANDVPPSWDVIEANLENIADMILNESKFLHPDISEENKAILRDMRSVKIKLSDIQKTEVASAYGSYNEFRKKTMGTLILSNEGTDLDTRWKELCESYPQYFSEDITEPDQPAAMMEIANILRNKYEDDNGFDYDSAKDFLMTEIYEKYFEVPETKYLSQEYQAKLAKAKVEYNERLKEVKAEIRQYKKEVKNLKKSTDKLWDTRAREKKRNRLIKTVKRLDRLLRKPGKGAPSAGVNKYGQEYVHLTNIPEDLKRTVIDFCSVFIDNDAGVFTGNIRDGAVVLDKKIHEMQKVYSALKKSKSYMNTVVSEDMEKKILQVAEIMGQRRLAQLSVSELDMVNEIADHLITIINNEVEMWVNGEKKKVNEIGKAALREQNDKGMKGHRQVMQGIDKLSVMNLKPIYFFERVGGTLQKLWNDLLDGQDRYVRNMQYAQERFDAIAKKYHLQNWIDDEAKTFKTSQGHEISLTRGQALLVWATWKREEISDKESKHLFEGGIVYPDAVTKASDKGKIKLPDVLKKVYEDGSAHRIRIEDMMKIDEWLTEEQKAYADELVGFLSNDVADWGNEISRQLYGVNKFNEKYYIPINSAENFLYKGMGEDGTKLLKNEGFTKETEWGANNPIVVEDFTEIVIKHIDRMSMYNSMVIPLDNFSRVWNYQEKADAKSNDSHQDVKAAFETAWGKEYKKYVDDFLRDINGGVMSDSRGIGDKWISKFKKAAVMGSASVLIQQPSAIGRAFGEINPIYFVQNLPTKGLAKSVYEECKKYAPVAVLKEIGGFDTVGGQNMTDWLMKKEYKGKEKFKAFLKDSQYRDDIISYGPAWADRVTWAHIWLACKKEVQHKGYNGKKGLTGEALLEAAGKRFTEVINKTQVYDSVLSRSSIMRSSNPLAKMQTAFMAEPTTSLNILGSAMRDFKTPGKRKDGVKKVISVAVAQGINALSVSLIYGARDDDEEKNFWEVYWGEVAENFFSGLNPLTMIPFVKDVWSLFQGYSVDRSDMTIFSNFVDSITAWDSDTKTLGEKIFGTMGSIADIFGIPLKNLMRDLKAIANVYKKSKNSSEYTAAGAWAEIYDRTFQIPKAIGLLSDKKAELLYNAFANGNAGMYAEYASRYKNGNAVKSALTTQIKERYLEGDITETEASELLGKLGLGSNEVYYKIREWDTPEDEAEDTEDENAAYFTLEGMEGLSSAKDEDDEDDVKVSYSYLHDAIEKRDTAMIKTEIDDLISHGADEESIKRSVSSKWGKAYRDSTNSVERNEIQQMIAATGLWKTGEVFAMTKRWRRRAEEEKRKTE